MLIYQKFVKQGYCFDPCRRAAKKMKSNDRANIRKNRRLSENNSLQPFARPSNVTRFALVDDGIASK